MVKLQIWNQYHIHLFRLNIIVLKVFKSTSVYFLHVFSDGASMEKEVEPEAGPYHEEVSDEIRS